MKKARTTRVIMPYILLIITFSINVCIYADDANATQYLTIAKQAFPEVKEIHIFISPEDYDVEKGKINRAALQNKVTAKVYLIETSVDVNTNLKEIPQNSVLVVYQSRVLSRKSTILFMLSKCKKKKISLVTSSREYSESGALLGIVKENKRFKIILNLKQSEWLTAIFTEGKRFALGISEIIE
jgi:ABC-type uncharacterized transport system substrate-binding protein